MLQLQNIWKYSYVLQPPLWGKKSWFQVLWHLKREYHAPCISRPIFCLGYYRMFYIPFFCSKLTGCFSVPWSSGNTVNPPKSFKKMVVQCTCTLIAAHLIKCWTFHQIQCMVVEWGAVQCIAVMHIDLQCSDVQCSSIQKSEMLWHALLYIAVQCSAV